MVLMAVDPGAYSLQRQPSPYRDLYFIFQIEGNHEDLRTLQSDLQLSSETSLQRYRYTRLLLIYTLLNDALQTSDNTSEEPD
jgi:hypothetical protein